MKTVLCTSYGASIASHVLFYPFLKKKKKIKMEKSYILLVILFLIWMVLHHVDRSILLPSNRYLISLIMYLRKTN